VREAELYDELLVPIELEDVVVFFSDGVTEARNAERELFGAERLLDCLRRNAAADPGALVAAVRDAVARFATAGGPTDDLTCVVVKVVPHEMPSARAELEIRAPSPSFDARARSSEPSAGSSSIRRSPTTHPRP
jgi:hypothetical protein